MELTQVLLDDSFDNSTIPQDTFVVAILTINGREYQVLNIENKIGREVGCNITINAPGVSVEHAVIEAQQPNEHFIYDLGSTNKTKINNVRLKPHVRYALADGAVITFANIRGVYKYVSPVHEGTSHEVENSTPFIPETPVKSNVRPDIAQEINKVIDDDVWDEDMFEEHMSPQKNPVASVSTAAVPQSVIYELPTQQISHESPLQVPQGIRHTHTINESKENEIPWVDDIDESDLRAVDSSICGSVQSSQLSPAKSLTSQRVLFPSIHGDKDIYEMETQRMDNVSTSNRESSGDNLSIVESIEDEMNKEAPSRSPVLFLPQELSRSAGSSPLLNRKKFIKNKGPSDGGGPSGIHRPSSSTDRLQIGGNSANKSIYSQDTLNFSPEISLIEGNVRGCVANELRYQDMRSLVAHSKSAPEPYPDNNLAIVSSSQGNKSCERYDVTLNIDEVVGGPSREERDKLDIVPSSPSASDYSEQLVELITDSQPDKLAQSPPRVESYSNRQFRERDSPDVVSSSQQMCNIIENLTGRVICHGGSLCDDLRNLNSNQMRLPEDRSRHYAPTLSSGRYADSGSISDPGFRRSVAEVGISNSRAIPINRIYRQDGEINVAGGSRSNQHVPNSAIFPDLIFHKNSEPEEKKASFLGEKVLKSQSSAKNEPQEYEIVTIEDDDVPVEEQQVDPSSVIRQEKSFETEDPVLLRDKSNSPCSSMTSKQIVDSHDQEDLSQSDVETTLNQDNHESIASCEEEISRAGGSTSPVDQEPRESCEITVENKDKSSLRNELNSAGKKGAENVDFSKGSSEESLESMSDVQCQFPPSKTSEIIIKDPIGGAKSISTEPAEGHVSSQTNQLHSELSVEEDDRSFDITEFEPETEEEIESVNRLSPATSERSICESQRSKSHEAMPLVPDNNENPNSEESERSCLTTPPDLVVKYDSTVELTNPIEQSSTVGDNSKESAAEKIVSDLTSTSTTTNATVDDVEEVGTKLDNLIPNVSDSEDLHIFSKAQVESQPSEVDDSFNVVDNNELLSPEISLRDIENLSAQPTGSLEITNVINDDNEHSPPEISSTSNDVMNLHTESLETPNTPESSGNNKCTVPENSSITNVDTQSSECLEAKGSTEIIDKYEPTSSEISSNTNVESGDFRAVEHSETLDGINNDECLTPRTVDENVDTQITECSLEATGSFEINGKYPLSEITSSRDTETQSALEAANRLEINDDNERSPLEISTTSDDINLFTESLETPNTLESSGNNKCTVAENSPIIHVGNVDTQPSESLEATDTLEIMEKSEDMSAGISSNSSVANKDCPLEVTDTTNSNECPSSEIPSKTVENVDTQHTGSLKATDPIEIIDYSEIPSTPVVRDTETQSTLEEINDDNECSAQEVSVRADHSSPNIGTQPSISQQKTEPVEGGDRVEIPEINKEDSSPIEAVGCFTPVKTDKVTPRAPFSLKKSRITGSFRKSLESTDSTIRNSDNDCQPSDDFVSSHKTELKKHSKPREFQLSDDENDLDDFQISLGGSKVQCAPKTMSLTFTNVAKMSEMPSKIKPLLNEPDQLRTKFLSKLTTSEPAVKASIVNDSCDSAVGKTKKSVGRPRKSDSSNGSIGNQKSPEIGKRRRKIPQDCVVAQPTPDPDWLKGKEVCRSANPRTYSRASNSRTSKGSIGQSLTDLDEDSSLLQRSKSETNSDEVSSTGMGPLEKFPKRKSSSSSFNRKSLTTSHINLDSNSGVIKEVDTNSMLASDDSVSLSLALSLTDTLEDSKVDRGRGMRRRTKQLPISSANSSGSDKMNPTANPSPETSDTGRRKRGSDPAESEGESLISEVGVAKEAPKKRGRPLKRSTERNDVESHSVTKRRGRLPKKAPIVAKEEKPASELSNQDSGVQSGTQEKSSTEETQPVARTRGRPPKKATIVADEQKKLTASEPSSQDSSVQSGTRKKSPAEETQPVARTRGRPRKVNVGLAEIPSKISKRTEDDLPVEKCDAKLIETSQKSKLQKRLSKEPSREERSKENEDKIPEKRGNVPKIGSKKNNDSDQSDQLTHPTRAQRKSKVPASFEKPSIQSVPLGVKRKGDAKQKENSSISSPLKKTKQSDGRTLINSVGSSTYTSPGKKTRGHCEQSARSATAVSPTGEGKRSSGNDSGIVSLTGTYASLDVAEKRKTRKTETQSITTSAITSTPIRKSNRHSTKNHSKCECCTSISSLGTEGTEELITPITKSIKNEDDSLLDDSTRKLSSQFPVKKTINSSKQSATRTPVEGRSRAIKRSKKEDLLTAEYLKDDGAVKTKRLKMDESVYDDGVTFITKSKSSTSLTDTQSLSRKSSRKSNVTGGRVLFTTGFNNSKLTSIVSKLGGTVVETPTSCTVLVTEKIRRTVKFLCCVALGVPIVTPAWLESCWAIKAFVGTSAFILSNDQAESKFKFKLQSSLEKARSNKLLDGWTVFITPLVEPTPAEIRNIIECSGGKALDKAPPRNGSWPNKTLIISCTTDKLHWDKLFKIDNAPQYIYSTELILSGVLQQKLDLKNNILCILSS